MIDVSRFHVGERCPRCRERRVYAVDEDRNLWLCIANAMPAPWRRDQLTTHDAAEVADDVNDVRWITAQQRSAELNSRTNR